MLEELKAKVLKANLALPKLSLVIYTWGNVSGIDREKGLVVIKPSGVEYDELKPDDMVVVDLNGFKVEGKLNPSSDTLTHIELYKAFPTIGGIVHTHSKFATVFAQARKGIPAFGTTHADYFHGAVPCTRELTELEVNGDYEKNTGLVIAETFKKLDYKAVPAVLAANHGPFAWGKDPDEAVYNAKVLEQVSEMALYTLQLDARTDPAPQYILDKHYERKHGKNSYYGQEKSK
jgi:L-ribulose-5-phosphate 4-epimerase